VKGGEKGAGEAGEKKGHVKGGAEDKAGMKAREREGERGSWCPRPHDLFVARPAPASIAAAEKRSLSYQTPQSVHGVRKGGAKTLLLTMHYGDKKNGRGE